MARLKARKGDSRRYVASFRHYRTGKIIRAKDYGLRGFPFGGDDRDT